MPWYDIFWNYDNEDGNVAHVAEHGLTPDDVNAVLMDPEETGRTARGVRLHAGRPIHLRRVRGD